MHIAAMTGDRPVVVVPLAPPQLPSQAAPAPAGVAVAAASGAVPADDARTTPGSSGTREPQAFFDPPLIAQRAVLGLPVGAMIAHLAETEGVPYAAAAAAVDREMTWQR